MLFCSLFSRNEIRYNNRNDRKVGESVTEEKQSQEQLFTKPKSWKAYWIYGALIFISVLSLYPSLVQQAEIIIDVREISDTSAEQLGALSLIQPILIGLGALLIGHFFAYRVKLRSLVYEKVNLNRAVKEEAKQSIPMALILGAIVGIVAVGFDVLFRPHLPTIFQQPVSMPQFFPILSNVLYGGIVEEVMLRFGLMTIVIYALSSKGQFLHKSIYYIGIGLSALIFALGHYPATSSYLDMTAIVWIRMLLLNGLGGVVFGWLYWKHHLEAAIFSHMFAHVTMGVMALLLHGLGV
jgi:hypothetical protein